MKALELATYIRYKTRTTTVTFTDADMLPLVHFRQDELARKLMNALATDEDIFLTPQYADLVASTSDPKTRSYGFPTSILSRIKRVEAKFDGTNWIRLYPMDINEFKGVHDETTITSYFNSYGYDNRGNNSGARYDILRKSLYIYSGTIAAVSQGLKLWCFDYPALIDDLTENTDDIEDDPSTTTHGFPRELHELLARAVIIDYKESREKPIPLTEREQRYDIDVEKAIATLKNGDQNREIIASVPYNDGSQY